jgi:hypothetical protein
VLNLGCYGTPRAILDVYYADQPIMALPKSETLPMVPADFSALPDPGEVWIWGDDLDDDEELTTEESEEHEQEEECIVMEPGNNSLIDALQVLQASPGLVTDRAA